MTHAIKTLCIAVLGSGLTVTPSCGAQWVVKFQTIDYPRAVMSEANGISSPVSSLPLQPSDIVGAFTDRTGKQHGFLLSRGQYTPVDFPGSYRTQAWGINGRGQIVGIYSSTQPGPLVQGFLRNSGSYLPTPCNDATEEAHGINNVGTIVGSYSLFEQASTVSYPPSRCNVYSIGGVSEANGINNAGQIVGDFIDATGYHGVFVNTSARFDFPGASSTWLRGINDSGYVVGYYRRGNATHGFLYDKQSFTTIDVPTAVNTEVHGINNGNARGFSIVGSFLGADRRLHAFMASLSLPVMSRAGREEK